eukprot:gene11612-8001_t
MLSYSLGRRAAARSLASHPALWAVASPRLHALPSTYPLRRFGAGSSPNRWSSPLCCTAQRRAYTDKVLIGASAATITSSTTIALFHLIVTPLSLSLCVATVATAAVSGSLTIIDGGDSTTSLGAIFGFIIGAMGGFYGKSQKEPWRK